MIIWIKGVPGSGKTWICSAITKYRNVVCIDTDDIAIGVYHKLKASPAFVKSLGAKLHKGNVMPPSVERALAKGCDQVVASLIRNNAVDRKILVFVGITATVPSPDKAFFIKMSKTDLAAAYRRVLLRETEKLTANLASIKETIMSRPIDTVGLDVHFTLNAALELTTTFAMYKNMYAGALRFERTQGLRVATQAKIIELIVKAASAQV